MISIRPILVLSLAGVILSGCASKTEKTKVTESQEVTPGTQKVSPNIYSLVTYNVGVFNKSGTNTSSMVASMMTELGAQAVSMNELDSCTTRNPTFQIGDFAKLMKGWNYQFAPAINYKGGKYGVGIVSSPELKIIRKGCITLDKLDGAEQRAMGFMEFEDFVFCSTHLDHRSASAQLAQAGIINTWAKENYGNSDKPVILCGDFNAYPDSETISFMKREWRIISPLQPTFSAKNPTNCIDYFMVYNNASSRVSILQASVPTVFSSGDVTVASDHLPVFMKVQIAPVQVLN